MEFIVEALTTLVAVQESPLWLKKQCGILLSACLMKEHGVAVVLDRIFGGREGLLHEVNWKIMN